MDGWHLWPAAPPSLPRALAPPVAHTQRTCPLGVAGISSTITLGTLDWSSAMPVAVIDMQAPDGSMRHRAALFDVLLDWDEAAALCQQQVRARKAVRDI